MARGIVLPPPHYLSDFVGFVKLTKLLRNEPSAIPGKILPSARNNRFPSALSCRI